MIDVERVRVDIRRLTLADLSDIERIEHRVYPTPWSRSMFAGELAKPSSICLGAFDDEERLVGYLIVSRYVDAWHIMNVAVDDLRRRSGIASRLLEELFERTAGDVAPRLHARGARLEQGRHRALRGLRLRAERRAPGLLHGQPRGRADHVEGPDPADDGEGAG